MLSGFQIQWKVRCGKPHFKLQKEETINFRNEVWKERTLFRLSSYSRNQRNSSKLHPITLLLRNPLPKSLFSLTKHRNSAPGINSHHLRRTSCGGKTNDKALFQKINSTLLSTALPFRATVLL